MENKHRSKGFKKLRSGYVDKIFLLFCNHLQKMSSLQKITVHMKSIVIILAGFLLLAFSCESKDDAAEFPEEQIIGQWNWQYSIYYYTQSGEPYVLNPDTLGFYTRYVFEEDGEFSVLRNEASDGRGIFWFENILFENGEESPLRLFTQQDNYIKSVNFEISGDTLILDETEVDGPKRVFLRIK